MSPYIEPPSIPEGMTIAEHRSSRPRHLSWWKHAAWWLGYSTHNKGRLW